MTLARELPQASIHVTVGQSLVVPLIVEGLPATIEALGRRWQRKREFHLTAVAARVIEAAAGDRDDAWDKVVAVASGRRLGPVTAGADLRRVSDPEEPAQQTLIVLADCPGLEDLHRALSDALEADLTPPPAHVTLYSTDPAGGIGITNAEELARLAPPLSPGEQAELRRAMAFP